MQNPNLENESTFRAVKRLRDELQAISQRARERHPILAHQDAIGLSIFCVSSLGIVASGFAYAAGALPVWGSVLLSAFLMSLLHELEHDLLHRLYFRSRPVVYNLLMAGVWLFRPSTINPWTRRDMHMHHHRVSGTESDFEERGITNGERWGLRRLLMTADSVLAIVLRPATMRAIIKAYVRAQKPRSMAEKRAIVRRSRLSYFPLGLVHYGLWYSFLLYHCARIVGTQLGAPFAPPAFVASAMGVVDLLVVVWLLPNVVRSFCLHFVSSNIHYYGDIDPRDVIQQTQVWTAFWAFPLQAFCFNFGATHAIHHFVVQDPFYLRQMIAKEAHAVMRAHGVRFNDFGTFARDNRWGAAVEHGSAPAPAVS